MEIPLPNPFSRIGIQIASNTIESEPEFLRIHRVINSGDEDRTIDFKEVPYASGKLKDFLNDVCSFANADGGLILLGVRQNSTPPHTIVGISKEDIKKSTQRLQEWARTKLLPNEIGVCFYQYSTDDTQLLVISVRKSITGPVYYEHEGGHIIKIRGGDGTRDARIEEITKLIKATPSTQLRINASILANDFRRHNMIFNKIFVEVYGGPSKDIIESFEHRLPNNPEYIAKVFHCGMITNAEVVHVRDIDKSLIPDDVVPMVGKDEIGNLGRIPAKSILYLLYEHERGSELQEFKNLCEAASKLLRQTSLELLYQVPSLYGIRFETLKDWNHVLIYAAFQHGTGFKTPVDPKTFAKNSFPSEKELKSRHLYKKYKIMLPEDARQLSARLLEEISAFG
ncbi:MAG: ATP-binding protein [Phycisphaerales bacterium]|nr:ATP-binding protein [Phycisphaerales bacterium]